MLSEPAHRPKGYTLHFHHYWLALAISLWAPFNHPISVFCLGCALGVFVEGFSFDSDSRGPEAVANDNCLQLWRAKDNVTQFQCRLNRASSAQLCFQDKGTHVSCWTSE